MEPTGPIKIRLEQIFKAFGEKKVLRGVDLQVHEGESLVILGGSGTGKSVLLKHVIGLLKPDSGTVTVDGTDLASLDYREITHFRRRFGMAFQGGALFDSMDVFHNIAFPLERTRRFNRSQIRARVEECLALVRLEGTEKKAPSELSGGMRRRIGFARAIALEPQILLFDEPTSGLDPVMTAVIDDVILDLKRTLQSTTITITHDMTSAFRIADRLAMLHHGKVIAEASPEGMKNSPDPRVRQFIEGRANGPLNDHPADDPFSDHPADGPLNDTPEEGPSTKTRPPQESP
ncbi:MAG: ABC transporter ATP-binding protein [Deltaproteobacteria bacterium]|nr:ABC transporter ATP-binding protein [Deltaproteobacteria bacterium]